MKRSEMRRQYEERMISRMKCAMIKNKLISALVRVERERTKWIKKGRKGFC